MCTHANDLPADSPLRRLATHHLDTLIASAGTGDVDQLLGTVIARAVDGKEGDDRHAAAIAALTDLAEAADFYLGRIDPAEPDGDHYTTVIDVHTETWDAIDTDPRRTLVARTLANRLDIDVEAIDLIDHTDGHWPGIGHRTTVTAQWRLAVPNDM